MLLAGIYYKISDGSFLILPISRNEDGWYTPVPEPERLVKCEVSAVALGERVLRRLEASAKLVGPPVGHKPAYYELVSDATSQKEFCKAH